MDRKATRERALAERARVRSTLLGLAPADWDADTLCAGWRGRDLAGHLAALAGPRTARFLVGMAAGGGGDRRPDELIAALDPPRMLPFFRLKPEVALVEYVVHPLDLARPLGRETGIPAASLAAALDGLAGGALPGTRRPPVRLVA